jgi:Ubiquitin family
MGEVHLRLTDGTTFAAALVDGMTVQGLKEAIAGADKANCEPERMKLVYKGKILKDADTLDSYGAWGAGNRARVRGGTASGPRARPGRAGWRVGCGRGAVWVFRGVGAGGEGGEGEFRGGRGAQA